jgi:hypothetical protein
MTKRRFGGRWRLVMAATALCAGAACWPARAQDAESKPKAAELMKAGDVLTGELNVMKLRGGKKGKRVATYQVTSAPRRLPTENGLCGLETGPETFQIIANEAQASQLKAYLGKEVSLRVDEVACSQEAGQMSDAVVTKWSVVKGN